MSDVRRARALPLLMLAYPLLALAAALTQRQAFALVACAWLLSLLLWPALRTRRPGPWLLWLTLLGGLAWLALHGWASLALDAVPLLVNLLLAWVFARSLRAGRRPLVAQFILAIEGPARLALPEIARYARHLTGFWALLLAVQAAWLGVLLACAAPGGALLGLGIAPPLAVPAAWVQGYLHVGGYLLIALVFVLEYAFRRWHLRHLPHLGLHALLHRLALRWPQLIRGDTSAS